MRGEGGKGEARGKKKRRGQRGWSQTRTNGKHRRERRKSGSCQNQGENVEKAMR